MKILFEYISLVFSLIGIIYLFFLLFKDIKKNKLKMNRERLLLFVITIVILISIVEDKLLYILN